MALPSPRLSPSRPMATVGGTARLRAGSAARNLLSFYRPVSHGVERRQDVPVGPGAISSRRRDLSVGVEDRRVTGHLLPHYPDQDRRSACRNAVDCLEESRGRRVGWQNSIVLLSGSYGCCSGGAPDQRTQELCSTISISTDKTEEVALQGSSSTGWAIAPVDVLCTIFEKLVTPKVFWSAARVCTQWRFAAFLLKRPMALAASGDASSVVTGTFPASQHKLLITKPSWTSRRKDKMEDETMFGYHKASAFLAIDCSSHLIGSCSGIPLFVATDGQFQLPCICDPTFAQYISQRYRFPSGICTEAIYLGTIDEDWIAVTTDKSLLVSRGGNWSAVSLLEFEIEKVNSMVLCNGVAFLLVDDRRLFEAHFISSSIAMSQLVLSTDLPMSQPWEKLWLVKCPTGATVLCIIYRELGNTYQFNAFDLIEQEGAWSWVRKATLGDIAVFVNWGSGSQGFVQKNPKQWGLKMNTIYHSHVARSCILNEVYEGRRMP